MVHSKRNDRMPIYIHSIEYAYLDFGKATEEKKNYFRFCICKDDFCST